MVGQPYCPYMMHSGRNVCIFQVEQTVLIRYQYLPKRLRWKHTRLVGINGIGFRTGNVIQLDQWVKYWQEAEEQQRFVCREKSDPAVLFEHIQEFCSQNEWLQEPLQSTPVRWPAWLTISSMVTGRSVSQQGSSCRYSTVRGSCVDNSKPV